MSLRATSASSQDARAKNKGRARIGAGGVYHDAADQMREWLT